MFFNLLKNNFLASTYIKLILNFFLNVFTTSNSSFFRSNPVFTKIQIKLFFID